MGITMNQFIKSTLILFLVVFSSCKALAQKFTTHAVKRGETMESIAEQYKVTPESILKYNKEISSANDIKPNTSWLLP
jgi:LysM repeat protein